MHLLFCVLLLKVVRAYGTSVTAYEGESITLPSGAPTDWELSSITWSIWPNTTWIATYSDNLTNVNHFYTYEGRLQLSEKNGNLILSNVRRADVMEYTVDLYNTKSENQVNKIKLDIKKRLQLPDIISETINDTCFLVLQCSSQDPGVSISWEIPPSVQYYTHTDNKITALLQKTETSVNLTCVSKIDTDQVRNTVPFKCEDPSPAVTTSNTTTSAPQISLKQISRDPIFIVPGFLLGVGAPVIVYLIWQRRKRRSSPDLPEI